MPANATKAQIQEKYDKAGVMSPKRAMTPEELQVALHQRSVTFEHKATRRLRDRGAQRRAAIKDSH